MQPLFAISVHDIDAGGIARSLELPLSWLERALGDTDVVASAPGHADVRLSKTGHDVIVRGKVTAALSLPCARCLTPVEVPVDTDLSLLLRPAKTDHAHGKHHVTPGAHGTQAKDAKDAAAKPGKDAKEAKDAKDPAVATKPGKHAAKANGANGKSRHHEEEEEYEFSSEEADTDLYQGETVILDDFLREALLLEVPSFPLCSEDCPGIRPSAKSAPERGEAPLDPRLSPLRALKTKLMLAASAPDAAGSEGRGGPDSPSGDAPGQGQDRPVLAAKIARPKIQAHRTKDSIGASGASSKAKSKTKHSPKKKAK